MAGHTLRRRRRRKKIEGGSPTGPTHFFRPLVRDVLCFMADVCGIILDASIASLSLFLQKLGERERAMPGSDKTLSKKEEQSIRGGITSNRRIPLYSCCGFEMMAGALYTTRMRPSLIFKTRCLSNWNRYNWSTIISRKSPDDSHDLRVILPFPKREKEGRARRVSH